MLGYFILEEDAQKLELLDNPELKNSLQETYFVLTNEDVKMLIQDNVNTVKFDNISNFLNKNYYDSMVESIIHQIKNK